MGERLRALGQIETMMALSHEVAHGTAQGLLALRLRGRLQAGELRQAMRVLHAKYAALRCVVRAWDGDHYGFEESAPLEAIGFRYAETLVGDGQEDVEAELDQVLDASRSLWSVALLSAPSQQRHLLILRYHHAIFDGESINALVEELLELCHRFSRNEPVNFGPVPLAPAIDVFLRSASQPVPRPSGPPTVPLPHVVPAQLSARRTRYLCARLETSATSRLKARCQAERLELHALLSAALLRSAHDMGFCTGPVDFKTAVSLRGCVPADAAQPLSPSCYLAVAETRLDAASLPLQEVAVTYRRLLLGAVMGQAWRLRSVSLEAVRAQLSTAVSATGFSGFGITNLGQLGLRHAWPDLEVTDYLPLARRVAGHHAFALHVVEFRQEVGATLVYTDPLLDGRTAGRLVDGFLTGLTAYADGLKPSARRSCAERS